MSKWSSMSFMVALAIGVAATPALAQRGRGGQRPPPPEVIRPSDQRVPAPVCPAPF